MFRIIVQYVIFQLLIGFAFGQVLFDENYTSKATFNDSSKARVLDRSLDYKFHQEDGGRLYIKDNDAGVSYKIDNAIFSSAGHKQLYISFCIRNLNDTVKEKFAGVVLYNDGNEVFGVGNEYFSENFSFWAVGVGGFDLGDIPTRVDGDVHKIVMKISFNPDGPEKIRIALDPFCRRLEDRQPDHIWTDYEFELGFDEIRLRSGNSDCKWEFDEIRIGTDFDSVTVSDDGPGEYIQSLISKMKSPGESEKVANSTVRFWQVGVDRSKLPPSFVLETPLDKVADVDDSWKLTPKFGTVGDKRYAYLDIDAETDLYGTGEVTGGLLRNGYKITLFNKDNYAYGKPDQLYQSHPWVLGVRPDGSAFGVIFDSTYKAELDLRAGILFSIPADAHDFPVIIIEGDSPQQVLTKLADLTGTMPMPPRWALGYQQCRYSYYPDQRVREVVDTFRAKQIPCDVLWFDIDYMDGFRIFTFDPNQFPDPKDTNDHLHKLGFKSVWMIDPGIKHDPGYFVYDAGTKRDAWVKDSSGKVFVGPVWPGNCVFPDFTSPDVRLWWGELYKKFMSMGIDGVWNDMNEPAVFDEKLNWTMPLDCVHSGGGEIPAGPHEQYHNVYGLLMVKASREGIQKADPKKRPFVLSRANFLGGHRYAATWTGDNKATWQHLKWSIPMSLNLSLSGQPFNGPDIGGFVGDATPELWAHWISVGAFYPFSRAHSAKGTADQEPWSFGKETEQAARAALQQRYRLMPYLYTLFRDSHLTGMPIMRPVFFADPSDISLRKEQQSFLLGHDLMIIPAWAKDVKMPKCDWQEVSILDCDAEDDKYQCNVKVRPGAIVPIGPVVQTTEQIKAKSPLTLIVVADKDGRAEGKLYEDKGQGYDYLEGKFCQSTFKAETQGDSMIVKCVDQQGKLKSRKRLVSVKVVKGNDVYHGFGDICSGVKVKVKNVGVK